MADTEYYELIWMVINMIIHSMLQEKSLNIDGLPANISLHETNGLNSTEVVL